MNEVASDFALLVTAFAISHWVGPPLIRRMVKDYANDLAANDLAADDRGLPQAGRLIGRL